MKKSRLDAFVAAIKAVRASIDDSIALTVPQLYPDWSADKTYAVGDRVLYDGTLYACLQPHTSQLTWTPSDAPSLWVRIDDPAIEWPDWIQPVGSTDAYPMGAKVSHNGGHWTSTIDGNVWEPGVYGWESFDHTAE